MNITPITPLPGPVIPIPIPVVPLPGPDNGNGGIVPPWLEDNKDPLRSSKTP